MHWRIIPIKALMDFYLDFGEFQGFERGKGVSEKQLNKPEIKVLVLLRRVRVSTKKKLIS